MAETDEEPTFFPIAQDFRDWLNINHKRETELWVGFYKKNSGIPSITWPESVDQALCFGWIDGIRKSIDEKSYKIRFTPRKPKSHWSDVNITKIAALKKEGLMHPAGLEAFKLREESRSSKASYEQSKIAFNKTYEAELRSNEKAWSYFSGKSPTYRKQCIWWIMSAKQESTRIKRLQILISSSEANEVVPPFRWSSGGNDKKKGS